MTNYITIMEAYFLVLVIALYVDLKANQGSYNKKYINNLEKLGPSDTKRKKKTDKYIHKEKKMSSPYLVWATEALYDLSVQHKMVSYSDLPYWTKLCPD